MVLRERESPEGLVFDLLMRNGVRGHYRRGLKAKYATALGLRGTTNGTRRASPFQLPEFGNDVKGSRQAGDGLATFERLKRLPESRRSGRASREFVVNEAYRLAALPAAANRPGSRQPRALGSTVPFFCVQVSTK